MDYNAWRNEVFGKPPNFDPVWDELSERFDCLAPSEHVVFIDRILMDPEVHETYTVGQIGIGLRLLFDNCSSTHFAFSP